MTPKNFFINNKCRRSKDIFFSSLYASSSAFFLASFTSLSQIFFSFFLFSISTGVSFFNNPYNNITKIANLEGGEAKGGFFENSNVDYLTVAVFDDFSDL